MPSTLLVGEVIHTNDLSKYSVGHGILVTRYTMASAEKSIIPEFELSIQRNGRDWSWNRWYGSKTIRIWTIKTGIWTDTINRTDRERFL